MRRRAICAADFCCPGLVDTHVHFPQLRVLGGLGDALLDWLDRVRAAGRGADGRRLRMRARRRARFVRRAGGARHDDGAGLRRALRAGDGGAVRSGASIAGCGSSAAWCCPTGLLRPELASDAGECLSRQHGLDPALSRPRTTALCGDAALRALDLGGDARSVPDAAAGTRRASLSDAPQREPVARSTKWRSCFRGRRTIWPSTSGSGWRARGAVMAHNVHPTESELERLAASGTAVAHCPCSNAALGSGIFPLRRHLAAGRARARSAPTSAAASDSGC